MRAVVEGGVKGGGGGVEGGRQVFFKGFHTQGK